MNMKQFGEWAFLIGILLAILAPFAATVVSAGAAITGLTLLGLIVGFLNITEKESLKFLVSSAVILIAGAAGLENLPYAGTFLGAILSNVLAFVAPAALVVALKAIYDLAGKKK